MPLYPRDIILQVMKLIMDKCCVFPYNNNNVIFDWIFYNGSFTRPLGLRMVWSNQFQGVYSPYAHSQNDLVHRTAAMAAFNSLITHFLGFEVLGNILQQPRINAHCLIAHF